MKALLLFLGCVVFNIVATMGVFALTRSAQMRGVTASLRGDQR